MKVTFDSVEVNSDKEMITVDGQWLENAKANSRRLSSGR